MTAPLSLFCGMASLYLVGSIAFFGYLATEKGPLLTLGKGFWVFGFFLHSLFLLISLYNGRHLPAGGPFEAALFFAWCIVLASYLALFRYRIRVLGAFVLPIVFFLILVASFHSGKAFFRIGSASRLYFGLHTTFLFLGYASFALVFVTALMYLVLEREIKAKKIGRPYRWLPPLGLLEEANGRFMGAGTILYALGILFGLFWLREIHGFFFGKDPKMILAFLTLALYGLLYWGNYSGWIDRKKGMVLSVLYFFWIIATFVSIGHPVSRVAL